MSNLEEANIDKDSTLDLEPRLNFSAEARSTSTSPPRPSFIARMPWVSDPLKQTKIAFALSSAAIGPVFGTFGTYVSYQLQYIGYAIGANPGQPLGTGCLDLTQSCRVPFGSGNVNLTSLILYLNAIAFALSGALCLLISGVGDYMGRKREQYIILIICYGAFALPVASMTAYNLKTFNSYCGLSVVFNTVGFLAGAWQNIYIPDVMHGDTASLLLTKTETRREREIRGVNTSVWGFNAYYLSLIVFYCITIGITFVSPTAATQAGLWVTTTSAVLCIVLAAIAWPFLPSPQPSGVSVWKLPLITLVELWRACTKYRHCILYLVGFVIYNDSVFAFAAVIGQLFNLQLRPSVLEFTYYSIVGTGTSIIAPTVFMLLFRHTTVLSLRSWTIFAYSLIAFTCLWCCIGFSSSAKIGFKHRWEFYLFQVITNIAYGLMPSIFRVLYCELFPKGAEIQYFSFQLAISCATVWIPQVVDSFIVDATNLVRLPAAVALAMMLVAIGFTLTVDVKKGTYAVRQAEETAREYSGIDHKD